MGRGKEKKHPQNQVISIDLEEVLVSIKQKILRSIEAEKKNWQ